MSDREPASRPGRATRLPPVKARQAVMLGHMRYVLAISVALAIVAFAVIYFTYF
jgi:hypothetical protein